MQQVPAIFRQPLFIRPYMCGIAGSIRFSFDREKLEQSLHHRGPDARGMFASDDVELHHFRLSILDLEGGVQPMTLGERYTVVFNGEIYNHLELRQAFGLKARTHSDTETLLLMFEKFGPACLHHFDGMFAFAVYDHHERKIFLARDRAGKKPLYLYRDGGKIVFASELNALHRQLPLEIEESHFFHYLRLGVFYRPFTPYRHVTELTGGTYVLIDCQSLEVKLKRWWNINDHYLRRQEDSMEQALEKTEALLDQAVRRRVESSDLEVGSFLSGGIDSGLITAFASRYTPNLKTLTVSFSGEYDEAPLARKVAEAYRTHHTEIRISFDNLRHDVERILCNYGEPYFDSSCIPSYYVSQAAKQYVTVVLNGDGADELFGGYRRYVPFSKYDFFRKNLLVSGAASVLNHLLPPSHNKKSKYFFLTRLVSFASKESLEIYLSAGLDLIEDYEHHILHKGYPYLEPLRKDFNVITGAGITGLQKIMNLDFDTNLFSDLLVKMDIATMAHSLEGRSPFLAKELLEYVPGLADPMKVQGGTSKFLLRQLAAKYLPAELVQQPKRGFEIPLKQWINGQLREIVHDYVGGSEAFHTRLLDPAFTRKLLDDKARISAEKRAKILWMLFCLEVWYRKVYRSN